MVIAQPISEYTGIPALGFASERFTFPVSVTFVGATQAFYNITASGLVNGTKVSKSLFGFRDFGTGTITLSGKGALSVDNIITEDVRWITPNSLEKNFSHATMSFHTAYAIPYPEVDNVYGAPTNAYIPLNNVGPYLAPNGTKIGTLWIGGEQVTFVEAGQLVSNLFMNNLTLTGPTLTGGTTLKTIDITGIFQSPIEIGTEEATSTIRNNDWTITLTFAILLFAVLDLGSYENSEKGKPDQSEESKDNADSKDASGSGGADSHEQRKPEEEKGRSVILRITQPIAKLMHLRPFKVDRTTLIQRLVFLAIFIPLMTFYGMTNYILFGQTFFDAWILMNSVMIGSYLTLKSKNWFYSLKFNRSLVKHGAYVIYTYGILVAGIVVTLVNTLLRFFAIVMFPIDRFEVVVFYTLLSANAILYGYSKRREMIPFP
jgi:hypothetical protein